MKYTNKQQIFLSLFQHCIKPFLLFLVLATCSKSPLSSNRSRKLCCNFETLFEFINDYFSTRKNLVL